MKCVIPVTIGTTGIETKGLKHIRIQCQDSIQQILYKNSCTRDMLQSETWSLIGGVHQEK
jgi:hypothetical protein